MWSLRGIYQKSKGFTLIEVLLAITLSTLIFLPLYNILDFSTTAFNIGNDKDELLLNGRYGVEYIKKEIKYADMILSSDMVSGLNNKYKTNIGFVIMKKDSEFLNRYTTYYTKGNKLFRISGLFPINSEPNYSKLEGHNEICEYVDTLEDTVLDIENNLIRLDIKMKAESGEKLNINTDIYIRCPLKY